MDWVGTIGLALAAAAQQGAAGIEWHGDLASASALARAADRPLFVVFRCER